MQQAQIGHGAVYDRLASQYGGETSGACRPLVSEASPLLQLQKSDVPCTQQHSPHMSGLHRDGAEADADADARNFGCSICLDVCYDPVVTTCGHLFCWPCLYRWLSLHCPNLKECPVCKADVQQSRVIPLYGRGRAASSEFLAERFPGVCIPCRPSPMLQISSGNEPVSSPPGSGVIRNAVCPDEARHYPLIRFSIPVLQVVMSNLLPPSMSRLVHRTDFAALARRRRYNNEKEFVLHWGFIVLGLLASLAFLLS